MNTKNNFLLSIIFACSTLNCTTFYAQEEKSADIVHQKSLLSFLPQETSDTRTSKNSAQAIVVADFADYKQKGEPVDFCMVIPNTPIDWDNVPKIEKLLKLIAKKDTPVDEGTISQEIADEIGMLDETKTLQENFIHAVKNQEYKRVINCLALEQHYNKNQKTPSDKEPKQSLMEHAENNRDLKFKIEYMMCCDPELLLLVIQDRKFHQKKISDWRCDSTGRNLLSIVCQSHHMFQIFQNQNGSLNLNVIQILIDAGVDPNGESPGGFMSLHSLCSRNSNRGHKSTTTQRIHAARKLLLAGADISIECYYHLTPINLAKEDGENEITVFLENFTMPEPAPEVITFENEESFKYYMKNKPDSSN